MAKEVKETMTQGTDSRRERLKDALVAATLADLVFIRVWSYLLDRRESAYLAETPFNRVDYIAVLLNTGVFAVVFYLGARWTRGRGGRWPRELATVAFFAFMLPVVDFVRRGMGLYLDRVWFVGGVWLLGGLILFGFAVLRWRSLLRRALYRVLLVLSPFVFMTVIQAVWIAISEERPKPEVASLPFPESAQTTGSRRVIWVIFDEWDQRVTFDRRPAGLMLPNIDAFTANAVVATQAYAPSGATEWSIPSLLMGRYLEDVRFGGADSLLLQPAGEATYHDFRRMPNLLTDAAGAGKRVAVVGWCHPYSRLFPANDHFWVRWGAVAGGQLFRAHTVPDGVRAQLRFVFAPQTGRQACVDLYARLHAAAREAVRSPAVDIAFIHYPIPHAPSLFDRERGVLSSQGSFSASAFYLNNLALVDQTLGQLMADLEATGLREKTSVVLSSDHWWRTATVLDGQIDYRIPLMIQVGGDRRASKFDGLINTVSVTAIIGEMLQGAVKDQDAVLARLKGIEAKETFRYATGGRKQLLNAPVSAATQDAK